MSELDDIREGAEKVGTRMVAGAKSVANTAGSVYATHEGDVADGVVDAANNLSSAAEVAASAVASGAQTVVNTTTSVYASEEVQGTLGMVSDATSNAAKAVTDGASAIANSEEVKELAEAARSAGAAAWTSAQGLSVPEIQFDVSAARSALVGVQNNAFEVASQAVRGCKAFALDTLKLEIFRDFFQFLGIFFASLRMPESFRLFFGNVAQVASASVQSLLRGYADFPAIYWYIMFSVGAFIGWAILAGEMRSMLNLDMRFNVDRKSKQELNWSAINEKDGKFRYKKVKYLLLFLMTIYVPVTRNSFQMIACANKYAAAQYRCEPNSTEHGIFYVYDTRNGLAGATKCTCEDKSMCPGAQVSSSSSTSSGSSKTSSTNYIQVSYGISCVSAGYYSIDNRQMCAVAAVQLKLDDQFIGSSGRVNNSSQVTACSYKPAGILPSRLQWNERSNSSVSCGTNGYKCICAKTQGATRRRLRRLSQSRWLSSGSTSPAPLPSDSNSSASEAFDCFRDAPEAPPDVLGGKTILVNKRAFCAGCYSTNHLIFVFVSVLLLFFFSFAFPKLVSKVIESMVPKPIRADDPENPVYSPPSGEAGDPEYDKQKELYDRLHGKPVIFDDEGHLVEFSDKMFVSEVRKQKENPYASLYSGFEMKWAHYKTLVMWMKLLQILPTVVISSVVVTDFLPSKGKMGGTIGGLMAAAVMGVFLVLALRASPYVDKINDRMDHVSRVVLFITPCIAVASLWTGSSLEIVWGFALNLASFASAAFSISATIYVMSCCQTRVKSWTGGLKWSDPDGISDWSHSDRLPDWDLDAERKRRIWKPFWDRIFDSDPELSGISVEDSKQSKGKEKSHAKRNMKKMADGALCPWPKTRLEEMLGKLRERGFDAWEGGLMPVSTEIATMRAQFQTIFEGPDIWCDDNWITDPNCSLVKDGGLNSVNGFGRLDVDIFPYTLKIFWDGKAAHDWGEIPSWGKHAPRMQELWNKQLQPEVQRMRGVRQQIRGCAASGKLFRLVQTYTTNHSREVPDGQDENGNQNYRTEHYQIAWTFTYGMVHVKGDFGDSEWEQGFHCSMYYPDGEGVEIGGSQAGTKHHKSETFGAEAMGIDHSNYNMTPKLSTLLGQDADGENRRNCAVGYQIYMEKLKIQRMHLLRERMWDNYSLSWSFWYHIYNNDTQSQDNLTRYFEGNAELNPDVRCIPQKYGKELKAILAMTDHFNRNPGIAYWYVYWHDVWKNNSDLAPLKKNDKHFDTCNPKALCYRPMTRKQLEKFLSDECSPANPLGKKQKKQLDMLYAAIDEIYKKHPSKTHSTKKIFVNFANSSVNPRAKLEISVVTEYEGNAISGGSIEIKVPDGMAPGSKINVNLPNGKTITVTIPNGAAPGSKFKVNY